MKGIIEGIKQLFDWGNSEFPQEEVEDAFVRILPQIKVCRRYTEKRDEVLSALERLDKAGKVYEIDTPRCWGEVTGKLDSYLVNRLIRWPHVWETWEKYSMYHVPHGRVQGHFHAVAVAKYVVHCHLRDVVEEGLRSLPDRPRVIARGRDPIWEFWNAGKKAWVCLHSNLELAEARCQVQENRLTSTEDKPYFFLI